MNSDDLELFAHVAKVNSISRAAMDLGVNQSTISRRMGLLEESLGVRLFRRSGRGVLLTERGEQLLGYATTLGRTLDEARSAMRSGQEQGPAKLCIAAQPTIAQIMFGSLGHALKERYPDTQVRFVEGLASHILGLLSNGEVDLSVMYVPEHRGSTQFDLLLAEGVCLVTPKDCPLPAGPVDVRVLGELPLILPSTHHGLRVLVEALAARNGFTLNIALQCDGSISITKRLVLENCGSTVLPFAAVVEEVAAGQLKCYALQNPRITREVAIAWPQNRAVPEGIWEVTRMIRQRAAALIRDGAWPDATLYSAAQSDPVPAG